MSSKQQTLSKHNTIHQQFNAASTSQSNFQSIKEAEQLRTPPVAPLIYDDALEEEEAIRGLRINDLQKRQTAHSSQEEFEEMVQKMQSRMKALESRYLDLANFYKRELLANGTASAVLNHSRFSQQQLREGGDLTPYLAESQVEERKFEDPNESQQMQPFDQNVEKDLISELL